MYMERIAIDENNDVVGIVLLDERGNEIYKNYLTEGIIERRTYDDKDRLLKTISDDGYECNYKYTNDTIIESDNQGNESECPINKTDKISISKQGKQIKIIEDLGGGEQIITKEIDYNKTVEVIRDGEISIKHFYRKGLLTKSFIPLKGITLTYYYRDILEYTER